MKTVILYGSARKNGNTRAMLEFFLKHHPGESRVVWAYDTQVSPCRDCRYCLKHGVCCVKDDMTEIYTQVEEADNLVVFSPIYIHCLPAPLKTVIDRFQVYWARRERGEAPASPGKRGAIILNGGAPAFENQFLAAELVLTGIFRDMGIMDPDVLTMADADKSPFVQSPEQQACLQALAEKLGNPGLSG